MTSLVRAIAALGLVFVAWLLWGSRSREESMRAPIVRLVVKHPWLTAGALALGGMAIAAVMVISGVVPIKASSGHWRITAAFLDFAKTRSVATHSWGVPAPPLLDDDVLIVRGATHYEGACLPCHGGPGRSAAPVMAAMTPPPPNLMERSARWAPEELFSIVRHGIKLTGMPAWPVQQRDDEVWAMVAFLRRMPALDAVGYRRLAFGVADAGDPSWDVPGIAKEPPPRDVRDVCWRCHGMDGTGRRAGAFPSLAGQRSVYLYASLRAFRERSRFSGIMGEIASKLSDGAMREIGAYYERLPPRVPETPDEASIARGQRIATHGVPERDVPACVECHGPTAAPKSPAYPKLAAQDGRYLMSQLALFQQRRRGGTVNANLMHAFVNRIRQGEIVDVAHYYAAQPAGR